MLCPHWIPLHRGGFGPYTDAGVFAAWQPPFVKIVWDGETVPYLEDVPPTARLIVRNYPLSEQFHGGLCVGSRGPRDVLPEWPQNGSGRDGYAYGDVALLPGPMSTVADLPTPEQAAAVYVANAEAVARYCAAHGVRSERLLFEGPNEYPVWAHGYAGLARLETARLQGLHRAGLHGVAVNLGVGWPGNNGPDLPPVWDWAQPVVNAFEAGDYLGLHEYWAYAGPWQMWGWWAGRLLKCMHRVPILVTEAGIDGGVLGGSEAKKGWWDLPEPAMDDKARRYLDELWQYAGLLAADGRTQGIFIYSYDGNRQDWGRFDVRTEPLIGALLARIAAEGLPASGGGVPEPVGDLAATLRAAAEAGDVLRVNPHAALCRAGAARGLWPTSNEFAVGLAGLTYIGQRFRDPANDQVYVLYCLAGAWNAVYELQYQP